MLIQKLRLQRGWSQEQLAEITGLSVRTVQRLERGHPGSLESMKALAAVFEIDLNRLKEPAMDTLQSDIRPDEALALAHVRKVKDFYIHLTQYWWATPSTSGSSGPPWAGAWGSWPTAPRCLAWSRSSTGAGSGAKSRSISAASSES